LDRTRRRFVLALAATLAARPEPARGRTLSFDDAVRELELIKPSRQKLAGPFSLDMPGGKTFTLSDHRGKVVFVNFWATWCPPCREEMPAMEKLWQRYREKGLVVVAVSVDRDPLVVPPFVKEKRFTFPVALDPKMATAHSWGVRALPASYFVDRRGYLALLALGPRHWDGEASFAVAEGLLR
jgi:thiol-disulfide isomerase/thioredoxin